MPEKHEFSLTDFLPYLLNRAAEESSADFAKIYKDKFGLLRTEWRVLFHLGQFGELTATEITQRSKIHKTKISRAVAALQTRRLLARTIIRSDRRSERLALTTNGQKMFEELAAAAHTYNKALLASVPEADRAALIRCLRGLIG